MATKDEKNTKKSREATKTAGSENDKAPGKGFSLIKAIRKEKIYKNNVQRRDKTARKYVAEHFKEGVNNKRGILPGQLMMFDYFQPKTEEDLEYYDAKPCTIFFGVTNTDDGKRVIGFNIHYYPPKMRYQIMDRVFEIYKSAYIKSWKHPLGRQVQDFDYRLIMYMLQKAKLDFGIRMYIPKLMTNIVPIPAAGWSKAVFTEGVFKKQTRAAILNYWKQKKQEAYKITPEVKKKAKKVSGSKKK